MCPATRAEAPRRAWPAPGSGCCRRDVGAARQGSRRRKVGLRASGCGVSDSPSRPRRGNLRRHHGRQRCDRAARCRRHGCCRRAGVTGQGGGSGRGPEGRGRTSSGANGARQLRYLRPVGRGGVLVPACAEQTSCHARCPPKARAGVRPTSPPNLDALRTRADLRRRQLRDELLGFGDLAQHDVMQDWLASRASSSCVQRAQSLRPLSSSCCRTWWTLEERRSASSTDCLNSARRPSRSRGVSCASSWERRAPKLAISPLPFDFDQDEERGDRFPRPPHRSFAARRCGRTNFMDLTPIRMTARR